MRTETIQLTKYDQAERFLSALFDGDDIIEIRAIETYTKNDKKKSRLVKREWLSALEFLARWGDWEALSRDEYANIFFGVCPRSRVGGAKKSDVDVVRALWTDNDDMTVDAALYRVREAGLPEPTGTVNSGHGAHLYWILNDSIYIESDADRERVERVVQRLQRAIGGDSTHDLARILRVPGFENVKNARNGQAPVPCELVELDTKRNYSLEQIEEHLPDEDTRITGHTSEPEGEQPVFTTADRAWARAQLSKPTQDRSSTDYRVARTLLERGCNSSGVAVCVAGLSKFGERNGTYTAQTIAKAKADFEASPVTKPRATTSQRRDVSLSPAFEFEKFPVEVFPGVAGDYIRAAADSIGVDTCAIALPFLSQCGAAIGNSRVAKPKSGWTEPSTIWTMVVAESGEKKSPALDAALSPIKRRQARQFKQYEADRERYEAEAAAFRDELSQWKAEKRVGEKPTPPQPPICDRCVVSDVTVEALAPRLQHNPRGLLCARDELAGLLGSFDAYKKSKGSDVSNWLSMHRAGDIIIDRKTGDNSTIYVPRAHVSPTGSIQPGTLRRYFTLEHMENGLASRFLLAMPPRRAAEWTDKQIPQYLEDRVGEAVDRLFTLQPGTTVDGDDYPLPLDMLPEAKTLWIQFYNDHARQQVEMTGEMAAVWSKLEGYAVRLALVIHFLRWSCGDTTLRHDDRLDAIDIESGVKLVKWFGHEARRVYGILSETDAQREVRELTDLITRKGGRITERELMRSTSRYRGSVEDATAALDTLAKAGCGEWQYPPGGGSGGHPKKQFVLISDSDASTAGNSASGGCVTRGWGK